MLSQPLGLAVRQDWPSLSVWANCIRWQRQIETDIATLSCCFQKIQIIFQSMLSTIFCWMLVKTALAITFECSQFSTYVQQFLSFEERNLNSMLWFLSYIENIPWVQNNIKLSFLSFCLFVFLSAHYSDQIFYGSQASKVTFCGPGGIEKKTVYRWHVTIFTVDLSPNCQLIGCRILKWKI